MSENVENQEQQIMAEVTEDVTNKKCPNCGATVVFDPEYEYYHRRTVWGWRAYPVCQW